MLKNTMVKQPTEEDPDEGIKDLVETMVKKMVSKMFDIGLTWPSRYISFHFQVSILPIDKRRNIEMPSATGILGGGGWKCMVGGGELHIKGREWEGRINYLGGGGGGHPLAHPDLI